LPDEYPVFLRKQHNDASYKTSFIYGEPERFSDAGEHYRYTPISNGETAENRSFLKAYEFLKHEGSE